MTKRTNDKPKLDTNQYLSSLTKDFSDLTTRVAAITLKHTYSNFVDIVLLLAEYFQLISQALLIYPDLDNNENNLALKVVRYVVDLMNPGSWFNFQEHKTLTTIVFGAFAVLTFFKFLLLFYVIIHVKLNHSYNLLLEIWSWVFKVQARFTCFFITSFYFTLILTASQDRFDSLGIEKMGLVAICIVIIALEYCFSFYLQVCYCYVLPSKSFLASKSNQLEIITLIQKLVIQILQVSLLPDILSSYWIIAIVNLLFSTARNAYYFSTLPFYNWKALIYQAALLMIATSLNISCFIEILARTLGSEVRMNLILALWLILTLMMIKISHGHLDRFVLTLVRETRGSAEYLIHKITLIKRLKKEQRTPGKKNDKYELSYLVNAAVDTCIQSIFNLKANNLQEIKSHIHTDEDLNRMFLHYVESLAIKFPRSGFIKLYSAYICVHKLQNFSVAMKLITDIKQSYSGKIKLSAYFLIREIQDKISSTRNQEKSINLSQYIHNLSKLAGLKEKMLAQGDAQSKILQEVLKETPDLHQIFKLGQVVDTFIHDIQKDIKLTLGAMPDTYIEPLIVYAHYYLILNHAVTEYLSYYEKYCIMNKKYEKWFKHDKLAEENIYQTGNILVVISGSKADAGKILYCSKSIEKIYGNITSAYIGTNISALSVPSLHGYYASYFKSLADRGNISLLRNVTRAFGYHAQGHMFLVDFYIDFNPFMTQSLCFNIIVRSVPRTNNCLLLLENGDIECASENIGKRLGLLPSQHATVHTHIRSISKELDMINIAFNIVAVTETAPKRSLSSDSEMSSEKANELYSICTTKGMNIELKSINGSNIYSYHCRVENIFYETLLMKVVTLDENIDNELDELQNDLTSIKQEQTKASDIQENFISNSEKVQKRMISYIADSEEPTPPDEIPIDYLKIMENKKCFKMIVSPSANQITSASQFENAANTEERLISVLETKTPTHQKFMHPEKPSGASKLQFSKEQASKSSKTQVKGGSRSKGQFGIERSVSTSHLSKSSQQEKISNAVKTALRMKYYANSLKIVCILFYLLLVIIFVLQTVLKESSDETLRFILTSKNIVSNAEMRIFLLVNIQKHCRIFWDMWIERLTRRNMSIYLGLQFYINKLVTFYASLKITNHDLFTSMNSLDQDTRRTLFMRDVKIYESYFDEPVQVFNTFDNFQATSRIMEAGLRGVRTMATNVTQSEQDIKFLLRNSVNDLLLKNEMTSDVLMEAVNFRQSEITTIINYSLIAVTSLMLALAIAFVWAVWKQYKKENLNMQAVIKLNPTQIKTTLDRINQFRGAIIDEKRFDENQNIGVVDFTTRSPPETFSRQAKKKENVKNPRTIGIRNKYFLYLLGLLSFIGIFSGLTNWYALSNKNSIDFSQKKQTQFFFISRLKSQISLTASISPELFANNGTTLIHNRPTSEDFPQAIRNLFTMKNKLSDIFMNEDFTFDPKIQDILFNDGCVYLDQSWNFMCTGLKNSGKKTSLIYLLTETINILDEANMKFQVTNNRSYDVLSDLEGETYGLITLPHLVSEGQCDALSKIIGEILENNTEDVIKEKNLEYGIFIVAFVIFSMLIWVLVLNPLREANNRFKKVLQAFPPNLILSSFLLKSFLMKTSDKALDPIKNYI